MRTIGFALLLLGLSAALAGAAQAGEVYTVGVDGLGCPFCAYGVEKELGSVDGVDTVDVDIESGVVVITMAAEATLDRDTARKAVENAGFDLRSFARVSEE
jgi:mercuric ion binding protein